jgi:hypothetical protein
VPTWRKLSDRRTGNQLNMQKKKKCDFCDKQPVVWYWYGCYEDENSLTACVDHQKSIEWARVYSFRIEKIKDGTTDLQEIKDNIYMSRGAIDKIRDEMVRSPFDGQERNAGVPATLPTSTSADDREHLIDSILAALPCPPQISRNVFASWSLDDLQRFAPSESFARKIEKAATPSPPG